MPLTAEQLQDIDYLEAQKAGDRAESAKNRKQEMVRLAKDILVENRRVKPAAEVTDITAESISTLAQSLTDYINS